MIIGENKLKDVGRVFVWFFLRYLILVLPSPLEIKVTSLLGRLFYHIASNRRGLVRQNMTAVLGRRSDIDHLVRLNFENHFIDQYLIFSFQKMKPENISNYITFEGLEHLEEALKQKKGVLLAHGHIGPRLLPLFALGSMGHKMNQIEGPIVDGLSPLGSYCARQKTALERLIPTSFINGQKFLRPAFTALSHNEIIMIAIDGMGGGKFLGRQCVVNFFNHKLLFPAGPVLLASKTGATLLPLFTIRQDFGVPYKAMIGKAMPIRRGKLSADELTYYVENMASLMADTIQKSPSLWHFWDEFYNRTANVR